MTSQSRPGYDGASAALAGAELSAAARVTKALDMACQYSGGIEYGDGPNAELLSWADIRDVLDQHRDLLAALDDAADFLGGLVGDEDQYGRTIIDENDALLLAMRAAIAKALGVSPASPASAPTGAPDDQSKPTDQTS